MAVKLLFEDNENSPSSVLLKHSMHGDNIYIFLEVQVNY